MLSAIVLTQCAWSDRVRMSLPCACEETRQIEVLAKQEHERTSFPSQSLTVRSLEAV